MHARIDGVKAPTALDREMFRAELRRMASRAERVSFARGQGARVELRRSKDPGRIDIRIVRDGRVMDAFDCSIENAPRILDRDEAGIHERLQALDRELVVERFYARTQGLLDGAGGTQQGRELAVYVGPNERLQKMIVVLMHPNLAVPQLERAVRALNEAFDAKGPHQGMYSSFLVELPCGRRVKIKVWQDMGNVMSFQWE